MNIRRTYLSIIRGGGGSGGRLRSLVMAQAAHKCSSNGPRATICTNSFKGHRQAEIPTRNPTAKADPIGVPNDPDDQDTNHLKTKYSSINI